MVQRLSVSSMPCSSSLKPSAASPITSGSLHLRSRKERAGVAVSPELDDTEKMAMTYSRLRSRLLVWFSFWALLLCLLGLLTVTQLRATTVTLESVYRNQVLCQVQLREVADVFRHKIPNVISRFEFAQVDAPVALAQIAEAQKLAALNWQHYRGTALVDAEKRLVAQAEPLLQRADAAASDAGRLIADGHASDLAAWMRINPTGTVEPLGSVIDQLFAIQQIVAAEDLHRAQSAQRNVLSAVLLLIVVSCGVGGAATWGMVVQHTAAAVKSEKALQRMNAFYTALSRTNQLIVRSQDEETLLRGLCSICTETGHARITAVFRLNGQQATRLAVAGQAADFFDAHPETWDIHSPEYRQSVTAIALTTGRRGVGKMARSHDGMPLWRETAQAHGIRSIAALPLRRGGKVCGTLSLYAGEADFFDEALLHLLDEMAADVSFALDNLDREAARLRLENQTQLDLARFQSLFRAAPVASLITSLDNLKVLEINDVMCQRYGLVRHEIVGTRLQRLGAFMVEEDARVYGEHIARDGRVCNMEARVRMASGERAVFIINAETISYDGQACVMAMALDVTELRAAEMARQAQATAEAANREKTAFLSRMSHELRTPLNAMLGFTQLMQRDGLSRRMPQDVERLEHIRQAGWHLLSLLDDVMDVSRIESGQVSVQRDALPLAGVIEEAVRLCMPAAQANGIDVAVAHGSNGQVGVFADALRLRQVFVNLLSNAVKYNRPGGSVRVRIRTTDEQVVVEVADTGLGMSDDQLLQLYEPFNRLGRERGGIEGTGLGLALSRQLVGLMGGGLVIESRLGVGTTARVTLPMAHLAATSTGTSAARPALLRTGEPHGTVLYIEDNDINVMLIEEMLSGWPGVRLLHARDGQTGIEQASQLQPDLILLDMHLPDIDGPEILRRLRAMATTAELRVIALSANAAPDDVDRMLAWGAADYWTKPVDMSTFLDDVAHHLGETVSEG
ncbi:MAG: hypothetical protein CFE40_01180 [Burkholderiales bacterium PBB1]|nr:MAG: hypothetical protein CFE40_01180 [Burkholderiales bacterium PBB1]